MPACRQEAEMTILQTGQTYCYDTTGEVIPCLHTGQDGELRYGVPWPQKRFAVKGETVEDLLTGLVWSRSANLAEFPVGWMESLDFIRKMNNEGTLGFHDWRLPNRRELRSLMSYQAKNPALPDHHPFVDLFLGWYWTSTTAAINTKYAWYIHLEGARMFYGRKDQYYLLWPVRGKGKKILPATGQRTCHDSSGLLIPAEGSGQDGELQVGQKWPVPRFVDSGDWVVDRLTNLCWLKEADLTGRPVRWDEALTAVEELNNASRGGMANWRLPNINELESLVDCATSRPALPKEHPFLKVQEVYWSSTTSYFETDWAWALYLEKGALGVGYKRGRNFHVWAVADAC